MFSSSKFLTEEQEMSLARSWRDEGNVAARNRLVSSHFALAKSISMRMSRGKLDKDDLFHEAVLGLVRAAEKFDPEMGWRFSTYAQWWVRSYVNEMVIRQQGSVSFPNSADYRKLSTNLKKTLDQIEREALGRGENISLGEMISRASVKLDIPVKDIENFRLLGLSPAISLNSPMRGSDGVEGTEIQDVIADDCEGTEAAFLNAQSETNVREVIHASLSCLTDRERMIIVRRKLNEDSIATLEEISNELKVSRERVRQIEVGALEKMRGFILKQTRKNELVMDQL